MLWIALESSAKIPASGRSRDLKETYTFETITFCVLMKPPSTNNSAPLPFIFLSF